jgi:PTS system sucrose-specific IIC component
MCVLEKKLHKIVPEMIDLFVTPLVSVLVTGYVTLTIIGPVFGRLENGVLAGHAVRSSNLPYGLGGAICGGLYALTVVAGVHHMYNALEAGLLSATGFNIWMPIATAANVAQGGAALAFSFKTHSKKQKSVALPGLPQRLPRHHGARHLRRQPALHAALPGGSDRRRGRRPHRRHVHVSATAYGITGLFGILITTQHLLAYLLVMAVAFAVSFGLTMVLYRDREESARRAGPAAGPDDAEIASPLAGAVVALKDVPDATFAEGILGQGIAVQPSEGKVVAPATRPSPRSSRPTTPSA